MRKRRIEKKPPIEPRLLDAYADKARATMAEIDAMPAHIRAIVHEHGAKHPDAVRAMRLERAKRIGDEIDRRFA